MSKPTNDKSLTELNEDLDVLLRQYEQMMRQLIDKGEVQLAGDLLTNYMASGRIVQMIGMKTVRNFYKKD